jgi:hypothetical protein
MALTVPDVGEVEFLTRGLKYEGSKLKLYTSNTTWSETSTVGSATECSTGGYAQITMTTAWTITTGASSTTAGVYAEQTFTFTSACTAYGYMITNSAATVLLIAEAFTDGPYVIPSGGGTIKVTPYLGAS